MSETTIIESQPTPQSQKPEARSATSLAAIAELYQAEDGKLQPIASRFEEDPAIDPEAHHLSLQADLMDIASNVPAKTFEDLFFKMVLWYWDAPDVTDLCYACRSDRVLLSVFKDLSRLSNQPIEPTI